MGYRGHWLDRPQERANNFVIVRERQCKYNVTFDDYAKRKTIVLKRGQQIRYALGLVLA